MGGGDDSGGNRTSGVSPKAYTSSDAATARTGPTGPASSADTFGSAATLAALPGNQPLDAPRVGDFLGGRYDLLEELGRGGEGVVFRARDVKADAVVALKLLDHGAGSASRLARFRRELALARKVTHPGVVRIHDLAELPGRFALSMEYVEGEPLDKKLKRTPQLPPRSLVMLAKDLARALGAAHEAGVTHRDLKPANVILRKGTERAVITDFGVSRLHGGVDLTAAEPLPDRVDVKLTREGAIIGTPLYMAPEQLAGSASVGPAADIYAFGLVLFEAATGRRPHTATSLADLEQERSTQPPPPLSSLRPDLEPAFAAVLDRCLEVDPKARFASGHELEVALDGATASDGRLPPTKLPLRRLWWSAGAIAGAAALGLLVWSRSPPSARPANDVGAPGPAAPRAAPFAFHPQNPRRITFGDGCEEYPSHLPDGKQVVFDATQAGGSAVFVLNLADGSQRQLTNGAVDVGPSVSPDGSRIAFERTLADSSATFVVDLDGRGPPRQVAPGNARPSWSADGSAVWAGDRMHPSLVAANDGSKRREIAIPAGTIGGPTIELADGGLLMALPMVWDARSGGLAVFSRTGELRWLVDGRMEEALALSPDRRHAIGVRITSTREWELVAVPLDGGAAAESLLASGVKPHKGLSVARDGSNIVWSTCRGVMSAAKLEESGRLVRVQPEAEWEDSDLAWVAGTENLVVLSNRGGARQPWVLDRRGAAPPRAIPVGGEDPYDLNVSPDGSWVALVLMAGGIAVAPLSGKGPVRHLTDGARDGAPSFRNNGRELLFSRQRDDGRKQVMSVPIEGGKPVPYLGPDTDEPAASPVDERVVFLAGRSGGLVPMVFDPRSHTRSALSTKLAPADYAIPRFSPDGKRVGLTRGKHEYLEVDVASGAVVRRFDAGDDQLLRVVFTSDELLFVRGQWIGDLWMADTPF